ncbi:hypothetical protein C8F01DRAFT_1254671 [Mycena amicta]|nr:hypothetical protein C8F01DRAFT_1254671 [Mycena amicta]
MSSGPKHNRAYIACTHCRKRKIKCLTNDADNAPCQRCVRRQLQCVYVPVAEDEAVYETDHSPTSPYFSAPAQAAAPHQSYPSGNPASYHQPPSGPAYPGHSYPRDSGGPYQAHYQPATGTSYAPPSSQPNTAPAYPYQVQYR